LELTVIAVEGGTVRLGISAPAEVRVFREEVWLKMPEASHDCVAAN
jgi:carbon storage regulator